LAVDSDKRAPLAVITRDRDKRERGERERREERGERREEREEGVIIVLI
jgi:hypothetical protein